MFCPFPPSRQHAAIAGGWSRHIAEGIHMQTGSTTHHHAPPLVGHVAGFAKTLAPRPQRRLGLLLALAAMLALVPPLSAQTRAPTGTASPDTRPRAPTFLLPADRLTFDPVTRRQVLAADAVPTMSDAPIIAPTDRSPEAALLRHLSARGLAAGLAGVIYDNRDRGHSPLSLEAFPQMVHLVYPPDLMAKGLDYGLAGVFRFPAITLGNSSTAIISQPEWRSQTRLMMTTPGGATRAAEDYAANALYIYPEHKDHDAVDMYPAAWPYTLTSQGSSHSDRPFLRTVALILAALRPDTRARLQAEGLVAPTVQMILRRTQAGVRSRADYLSGAAHPSAFDRRALAPNAAVALANSLPPDAIPPMVRLNVLAEDFTASSGLSGQSERLFDTPAAIARLWRGPAFTRTITISAAATTDPNGRTLTFDWVLLRGDPDAVTITPLAGGISARISIDWQAARPAPRGFGLPADAQPPLTARVDIGVFASNGVHDSAPAFVSVALPLHEERRYVPSARADGRMRLAEVDYDAVGRGQAFDPALWWSAPWRDRFTVDATGQPTGWTRSSTRDSDTGPESSTDFTPDGLRRDGRGYRYVLQSPKGPRAPPEIGVVLVPPAN